MMFQILLHHFICYVSGTPGSIPDCPKMIAPISLLQVWKFRLQQARRATFQTFDQIRESQFRRIFNVHMNMVFAYYSRQNSNIFGIANLYQQISATNFYLAFQNVIAIFCHPNDMYGQSCNRVMTVPVIFHLPRFLHRF